MRTTEQIVANLEFMDKLPAGLIAYTINGEAVNDTWKNILVLFNGNTDKKEFTLPSGSWKVAIGN
ncbi:MAG: hypothetical protein WDO16_15325 [Bacteroidota bacterium]